MNMSSFDRSSSSSSSTQVTVFVAVGIKIEESQSVLLWALENLKRLGGTEICILHVHPPDTHDHSGLTWLPLKGANERKVDSHRAVERKIFSEKLDEYLDICRQWGVTARTRHVEMDSIKEGIVHLLLENEVGILVMGASSDKRFKIGMNEIKSEKARYVDMHAPGYCQIWFVCKRHLIYTREAPLKSDVKVKELEHNLASLREALDDLQRERDIAIARVEEARRQIIQGASTVDFLMFCSDFTSQEIQSATNNFDSTLKIEEDTYGNIYGCVLRRTKVAVKIPHPDNPSVPEEFRQEVEILCKLRHPNIVNLIGICPESHALIHEHCVEGTLEDRLNKKDKDSYFPWQIRARIATDLCNVLAFLHSHKTKPVIHGDLRPENIHLDSKYICKLSGFKISNAISNGKFNLKNKSSFYRGESEDRSYHYTDPDFFAGGKLTTRSDVYAFGVILLRLLTGKQPVLTGEETVKLAKQVQIAVEIDGLSDLLDNSAGWPLDQAKVLADLALRCCEMSQDRRPDLQEDVWNVLECVSEFD